MSKPRCSSLVLLLSLSGCVWPHKEWIAPPASGTLVDARSHQAIAGALALRIRPAKAAAQVSTDREGWFEFAGVRKTRWLRLDAVPVVDYRFEARGYHSVQTRRTGPGWVFKEVLKDDIGPIQLLPK